MDRYDSFEMFMVDVVNKADEFGLNKLYGVTCERLIEYCNKIIESGWWIFCAICALLITGGLGFGIALGAFLLTPAGLIVVAVLGVAAATIIREIYRNKLLPLAIKAVGDEFKQRYEDACGNHSTIDSLYKQAVSSLIQRAKNPISVASSILLTNWINS